MNIEDEANKKSLTVGEYLAWVWKQIHGKRCSDNTVVLATMHYRKTKKNPTWYTQWKCKEKEKDYYIPPLSMV